MQGFGTMLGISNLILKAIGSHLMFSNRGVTKPKVHFEMNPLASVGKMDWRRCKRDCVEIIRRLFDAGSM